MGRERKLKILTVVTATALAGIIALQAYWLNSSFREQRTRFAADAENVLLSTLIRSQLTARNGDSVSDVLSPDIGIMLASVMNTMPQGFNRPHQSVISEIKVSDGDTASFEAQTLGRALSRIENNVNKLEADTTHREFTISFNSSMPADKKRIPELKKILDEELKKRGIRAHSELALLDDKGNVAAASIDPDAFNRISLKFTMGQLRAAFPDANLYLLRRMAWLLSISTVLILICCISFVFLLRLFFRQKRLSDIRNDFMNNMTHELKTPISSVSVVLEMVQDKRHPVTEETRQEYYAIAQGELKRLTMLVEKVLKMAAFEKSEIQLVKEPFPAYDWVYDIVRSLRPVFESAGAMVDISVQPQDLVLYADKTHLTNVLQNLVENALKYNDKAVPELSIKLLREDHGTVLSVADNGKGIPATYADKVFDKFFRVPSGDRHDTKGYGLGLSYVKAVTELHGGTVALSSIVGGGSTFTIKLPNETQ